MSRDPDGKASRSVRARAGAATLILMSSVSAATALAGAPTLGQIYPRGGQRGTQVAVDFTGERLDGAQEILFHEPGITAGPVEQVNASHARASLTLALDAPLGPHALRIRTASGLSNLYLFSVGASNEIREAEPNSSASQAQKLALGTTVNGAITNEDVDCYSVEGTAGQRVNIEIEALRLGGPLFDARIGLLDAAGREIASADDTTLTRQDGVIGHTFASSGIYTIEVRETAYRGADNYHYRLHVGSFPRPLAVHPAGGNPGSAVELTWLGDPGIGKQSISLPAEPLDPFGLFPQDATGIAPSAVPFRLSDLPGIAESEPNDDADHATVFAAPAALNGVIQTPGDIDWYRFPGTAGQVLDIRVWARALRSPLDSILFVGAFKGAGLTENDDSATPDSAARVTLPADGDYILHVRDHLRRGGPLFTYRVEVAPPQPRLTLAIAPGDGPVCLAVPQASQNAVLVAASRQDFGGPLKIALEGLPPGITAIAPDMPESVGTIPVLLSAAPEAALASSMTRFTARHADPAVNIAGELAQDIVSVYGDNRTIFWTHRISRLPVVVTQKVPFNIQIVQPGVPIVRNGMMELKVRATREAGFAEPIALKMLWNPPGIGSGQAIIAKDQSETTIHLDCNGGAPILKWPVVVIGTATVGNGPVEVSTQLAALDVSDMWVEFAVDKTRAEQGKGAELAVKVVKKRDFPGEARAELLGLPVKTSAGAQTVTKETAELKYAIQTAPDAPPGRYGNLFIRATIVENGESIVHQSGSGLLMIDAPLPPKPAEEAKPAEKPKKRRRPAPVTLGDWRIPCTPEFALAC